MTSVKASACSILKVNSKNDENTVDNIRILKVGILLGIGWRTSRARISPGVLTYRYLSPLCVRGFKFGGSRIQVI